MKDRPLSTWCGLFFLSVVMSASASALAAPVAKVATPTFSPATPYTFNNSVNVTILCSTSGATIHYTTDGFNPTSSSMVYSSPLTFTKTTKLRAKAFKSGMTDSAVASGTYTGVVATPTFSPPAGKYTSAQSVTISCATPEAEIRFVTNASGLTMYWSVYSPGSTLQITHTLTLRAKAVKSGMTDSPVVSASYTIVPPPDVKPQDLTVPASWRWWDPWANGKFVDVRDYERVRISVPPEMNPTVFPVSVNVKLQSRQSLPGSVSGFSDWKTIEPPQPVGKAEVWWNVQKGGTLLVDIPTPGSDEYLQLWFQNPSFDDVHVHLDEVGPPME